MSKGRLASRVRSWGGRRATRGMADLPGHRPGGIEPVTAAVGNVGGLAGWVNNLPSWAKTAGAVVGVVGAAVMIITSSCATAGLALPAWAVAAGAAGGGLASLVGSLGMVSSGVGGQKQ